MAGTSEGAKRGWDTRRANEAERQKRSDAAQRGWGNPASNRTRQITISAL